MYAIKQVNQENWQQIPVLSQFYDDIANKPYCSNDKSFSHIRTKSHAIKHAYIQPNHPAICKWLVFDIDDPHALFVFADKLLPRPQIIIKNPSNGHAHYAYKLTTPVGLWGESSVKAIQYLSAVQQALRKALGADRSYGGNLIKNPCHSEHETYLTGSQPSYTLAELAEYLNLYEPISEPSASNDEGYGRNVSVFNHVRFQAYPIAENYSQSQLETVLMEFAESYNASFDVPLLYNELRHIVKSIAKYCKRADFTASHKAFSERQSERAKRRWGDNTDIRKQAEIWHAQGIKKTEIAERLGVTTKTLTRWGLRKNKGQKRDMP